MSLRERLFKPLGPRHPDPELPARAIAAAADADRRVAQVERKMDAVEAEIEAVQARRRRR